MRLQALTVAATMLLTGCSHAQQPSAHPTSMSTGYAGFDRNEYPGDDTLPTLHKRFAFTGFWLNSPPGARSNTWLGKRAILHKQGFGFLVLANGRESDPMIALIKRTKITPEALGQKDAAEAIDAAKREQFPAGTILFLDQEEGGRLLPEAAAYLFAWTEAVAHSVYKPGAYLSGQPSEDGTDPKGKTLFITTAEDVQTQVAARHLSPVALFVYQDACPPSGGCTVTPPPLSQSGTPNATAWQYAQSPSRPSVTRSCAKTYAADGNCYATTEGQIFVDLDVAASPDPSHGR